MKRVSPIRLAVFCLLGIPLLAWMSVMIVRGVKKHNEAAGKVREFVRAIDDAVHYRERSIRYNAKWTPEDFFESDQAIEACNVISTGDNELLSELLKSGIDVDMTGKKGVTLLYWAFFDDKLDAFTQLLEARADPDLKLTDAIERSRHRPFLPGDSILFSTMRIGKWDYFFAAFEHTSNRNQRDGAGRTLLNASMGITEILSTSDDNLRRLVDAGVDLNTRDQYGCTAAMKALDNQRPNKCLILLKAGADPSIPNNRGETLVDRLRIARGFVKRSVSDLPEPHDQYFEGYDCIQTWLDEYTSQNQDANLQSQKNEIQ